jgi:hypothetical protein
LRQPWRRKKMLRTPTLEANVPAIKYEGELEESTLEVNMHHFYHGDPEEIHEFALQGAVAYESGKDDASSKEDGSLQQLAWYLEEEEEVPQEYLQQFGYSDESPESKTNEGMDVMLAALQASSSDETTKQAVKHMEHPFQHVERPQVRTIDCIVPNEDQTNHVLISEAEYQ